MATRLNMSTNGYGSIERGETDISLSRIQQISRVLNVEVTELFLVKQPESAISDSVGCPVCPMRGMEAEQLNRVFTEINTLMLSVRCGG